MNTKKIKVEMQTALTPLFRPVKDGEDRKITTEFVRNTGDGYVKFICPYILDDKDGDLLLAILALAQDNETGNELGKEPTTLTGIEARKSLDLKDSLLDKPAGFIKTTIPQLAKLLGNDRPGQITYDAINNSLERLSAVSINEYIESEKVKQYGGSGFIKARVNNGSGEIIIAICHRLAMAAFGRMDFEHKYVKTSLDDRLSMPNAVSKEVHRALSAWAWSGTDNKIGLVTLCKRVFSAERWDAMTNNAQQIAWTKVLAALKDIDKLPNWNLAVDGKGKSAMISLSRTKSGVRLQG